MSKPIRILYDEWGFQETHGGVSRYLSELMKNLPDGFEWKLTPVCTCNEYLRMPPFNLPPAKMTFRDFVRKWLGGRYFPGANHLYKILGTILPWCIPASEVQNKRARMRALRGDDYDIYHAAAWDLKGVVGRKPVIATVCDLIPELVYKNKRVIRHGRWLAKHATHFLTISEHTKQDLMRLYGIPAEKISVVYLGYNMKDPAPAEKSRLREWGIERGKYVLFVGKRAGYKNFEWMVKALSPLLTADKGRGIKLFCTGSKFTQEEQTLLERLGVADRVVQSFVSDSEMRELFENAVAFIYPSLYEGFGIPILDAFSAGCPAVISNASCFPEVAGNAALYFDPSGAGDDLCTHIRRLLDPSLGAGLRHEMSARGRERVQMFSWEKCASEVATVYRCVLETFSQERF